MGITYDESQKVFHLEANNTSYCLQVVKDGYLAHLHWGKRTRPADDLCRMAFPMIRAFSPNPDPADMMFSLDTLPREYPGYGNTDFRHPAYQVQMENGSTVCDLRYHAHRILAGKPKLGGLPATYVERDDEAQTLEVEMVDEVSGLKVILSYTAFEHLNAIARSARLVNAGDQKLRLLRALSASVDFNDADYDLLHLSGSWARERHIVCRPLAPGEQSIESRRGASSHQHNPFVALVGKTADEDHGEVYGFCLVYSGSFVAQAEVDQYATTRVSLGINPFDFSWLLEPGESFQTPEAVLVYSDEGLGGMSRTYHRLYRARLCRGEHRDKERPILINNWEATYFNFTTDSLVKIAQEASELGIELFVLDDGWFGKRNDDTGSLGDWVANREKLPGGLGDLANRVRDLGLQFGLWVEPEMVSPNSNLYRAHPDWCLHIPERGRSTGRNQLVLDLSRQDVCDAIVKIISDVLASAPISYVKWDMNRYMTEIGSAALPPERQRETAHRYMLGLYRVMDEITAAFPHILFESCAGGGGRFDPGMLYYMPQAWTSDNTDAVERLKIQYGTSVVYPPITMGAHVSATPNHQTGRTTPMQMRGHVAMSGNLGYELDLTKLERSERSVAKRQIATYKEIRHLVQFGDFYRLLSPFEDGHVAWMFVSPDKREVFVAYFQMLVEPNPPLGSLRLKGLDPNLDYAIVRTGQTFGGDELMSAGIDLPYMLGDFQSAIWQFKAKDAPEE
ncbi:MAG: alpha-galactosidase [Anaerolineae bacterium]|nr:alpha-galactosidase [Anaerolineae bacterium]